MADNEINLNLNLQKEIDEVKRLQQEFKNLKAIAEDSLASFRAGTGSASQVRQSISAAASAGTGGVQGSASSVTSGGATNASAMAAMSVQGRPADSGLLPGRGGVATNGVSASMDSILASADPYAALGYRHRQALQAFAASPVGMFGIGFGRGAVDVVQASFATEYAAGTKEIQTGRPDYAGHYRAGWGLAGGLLGAGVGTLFGNPVLGAGFGLSVGSAIGDRFGAIKEAEVSMQRRMLPGAISWSSYAGVWGKNYPSTWEFEPNPGYDGRFGGRRSNYNMVLTPGQYHNDTLGAGVKMRAWALDASNQSQLSFWGGKSEGGKVTSNFGADKEAFAGMGNDVIEAISSAGIDPFVQTGVAQLTAVEEVDGELVKVQTGTRKVKRSRTTSNVMARTYPANRQLTLAVKGVGQKVKTARDASSLMGVTGGTESVEWEEDEPIYEWKPGPKKQRTITRTANEELWKTVARRAGDWWGAAGQDIMKQYITPMYRALPETGGSVADMLMKFGSYGTARWLELGGERGTTPVVNQQQLDQARAGIVGANRALEYGSLQARGSGQAMAQAYSSQLEIIKSLPGGTDSLAFAKGQAGLRDAGAKAFADESAVKFGIPQAQLTGALAIANVMPYAPGQVYGLQAKVIRGNLSQANRIGEFMSQRRAAGMLSEQEEYSLTSQQSNLQVAAMQGIAEIAEGGSNLLPGIAATGIFGSGLHRFTSMQQAALFIGRYGSPRRSAGAYNGRQAAMQRDFYDSFGVNAGPHSRSELTNNGRQGESEHILRDILNELQKLNGKNAGSFPSSNRDPRDLPPSGSGSGGRFN